MNLFNFSALLVSAVTLSRICVVYSSDKVVISPSFPFL
ncbi:hypothetical protein FM106_07925 [Brachybacterium faecium]|nr:hypothetical protein FM106_07925 [Brachybacterium faecium]